MALPQQHRLSGLQLTILHSLYAALRRQSSATAGVPYSDLVRTLHADKTSITDGLRQLLRKGLVLLTLPRGGWTRHVMLTEQGKAYAKTLPSMELRQQTKADTYGLTELARHERLWQAVETRHERRRDKQPKRSSRRSRRHEE
jgi:DNA-binding MarR family transcriptional regulator